MPPRDLDPGEFRTLGWGVIDWIEAYLCHGPGDVSGEPMVLDDEFAAFILKAYRLDADGRRSYDRAFLSRPKGRAKSELAGAIVCCEALGPVRFDGWDAGGDPVGRPIRDPFIKCFATEEDQSGNTYDNVVVMLDHAASVAPDAFGGVDLGRNVQSSSRVFLPAGGEIVPCTASAAAKDGGKETFVVFDETHLYVSSVLHRMHATVRRNLRKRKAAQPWSMETSTMYAMGEESVAEKTHQYAEQIAAGKAKNSRLLFDHREAPPIKNWDDDVEVSAALRHVYGSAAWTDFDGILAEIRDPQSDRADNERYWMNRPSKQGEAAFDVKRWRALADATVVVPDGELIVLGFDGARRRDSTALVATHVESGHRWPVGVWERPEDAADDWSVDEVDVEAAFEEAFDRWDVWRAYCDPPYWEQSVARWQGRWGEKRVLEWWTNRDKAIAYAIAAFVAGMVAGDFTHDGDSTLARHVANCRKRHTRVRDGDGRFMWTIRKPHPDSPKKIDAAMAMVLADEARRDAVAAGARQRKQRRAGGF